jgi:hypothetical protein
VSRRRTVRELARQPFGAWEVRELPPPDVAPRIQLEPPEFWIPTGWLNNRYAVQRSVFVCIWGEVDHLWISRHDGEPIRSWPDLQRIKTELLGPYRLAVEVFPIEREVVDLAPMAHLWSPPPGFELPFWLIGAKRPRPPPAPP